MEEIKKRKMPKISFIKIWNLTKTFFSKPQNIILVFFAILLVLTVIYPLISLILDSFKVQSISEAKEINELWETNVKKGDFTWAQWPDLLFNKQNGDIACGYASTVAIASLAGSRTTVDKSQDKTTIVAHIAVHLVGAR